MPSKRYWVGNKLNHCAADNRNPSGGNLFRPAYAWDQLSSENHTKGKLSVARHNICQTSTLVRLTLPMTEVDVLILGAGAAGLMCAIQAGRRGRRVLVLEHADRPGKKILISGGGRCNFTNRNTTPDNFLSANPHFAKSALARYTPRDFLSLVEKHGIPWHEKTLGQLFCDRSAHDILNMLLAECADANARIQLSTRVLSVSSCPAGGAEGSAFPHSRFFRVETSSGAILAASLVIATGGLSIPRMGATPLGYDLARQFAHPIVETRPALVPLVFSPEDAADWCDLTGLSAIVVASTATLRNRKLARARFRESMLITHRGLSGPAILQISSYWRPGESIELDLAPDRNITAPLLTAASGRPARRDYAALSLALRSALPQRLSDRWLRLRAPETKAGEPTNAALADFERQLHSWSIIPAGTEGYAKAEVTAGGVSTDSLNARTLESRLVPGLYFIGEVVDVTGWLGGYNFQWAWASGFSAGLSV
jgi:predicted Rossmann fold flavoprotein